MVEAHRAFALSLLAAASLAAAPAASAATAEPAAAPKCIATPWIVYFDLGKADIDPTNASTLGRAAAWFQSCGAIGIIIAGKVTEPPEGTQYNVPLRDSRASAIRAHLVRKGVADNRIVTWARGVATPPGRIEIGFGPGGAW